MKVGSLFSGAGGLDLAVEAVFHAPPAWFVEFEKAPSRVLAHHWPDVPNHHDVTSVDWSDVEPVDIITGGYPCQPFSHAGQRKGTTDDRHLWPYVVEGLSILRPRFAVFENVQGHLSLGFDHVLRDLQILDYSVYWTLISASSIGAPHRRNRLFIFAEDNRGHVRSGTDRRRGLHRHSGGRRVFPGQAEGIDERQGIAPRREQIPGLRARGWSYERMAAHFGVSFETVKWDCHVLNKQKKQETAA